MLVKRRPNDTWPEENGTIVEIGGPRRTGTALTEAEGNRAARNREEQETRRRKKGSKGGQKKGRGFTIARANSRSRHLLTIHARFGTRLSATPLSKRASACH